MRNPEPRKRVAKNIESALLFFMANIAIWMTADPTRMRIREMDPTQVSIEAASETPPRRPYTTDIGLLFRDGHRFLIIELSWDSYLKVFTALRK
jgi:hypothetical protein